MKLKGTIISFAVIGLLVGAAIAELKPDMFGDMLGGIKAAMSKPFSGYRNELAVKYGLLGAGIGAAIGLVKVKLLK